MTSSTAPTPRTSTAASAATVGRTARPDGQEPELGPLFASYPHVSPVLGPPLHPLASTKRQRIVQTYNLTCCQAVTLHDCGRCALRAALALAVWCVCESPATQSRQPARDGNPFTTRALRHSPIPSYAHRDRLTHTVIVTPHRRRRSVGALPFLSRSRVPSSSERLGRTLFDLSKSRGRLLVVFPVLGDLLRWSRQWLSWCSGALPLAHPVLETP